MEHSIADARHIKKFLFIERKVEVNYAIEKIGFVEVIKHRPDLITLFDTSPIPKQKEFNSIRRAHSLRAPRQSANARFKELDKESSNLLI